MLRHDLHANRQFPRGTFAVTPSGTKSMFLNHWPSLDRETVCPLLLDLVRIVSTRGKVMELATQIHLKTCIVTRTYKIWNFRVAVLLTFIGFQAQIKPGFLNSLNICAIACTPLFPYVHCTYTRSLQTPFYTRNGLYFMNLRQNWYSPLLYPECSFFRSTKCFFNIDLVFYSRTRCLRNGYLSGLWNFMSWWCILYLWNTTVLCFSRPVIGRGINKLLEKLVWCLLHAFLTNSAAPLSSISLKTDFPSTQKWW